MPAYKLPSARDVLRQAGALLRYAAQPQRSTPRGWHPQPGDSVQVQGGSSGEMPGRYIKPASDGTGAHVVEVTPFPGAAPMRGRWNGVNIRHPDHLGIAISEPDDKPHAAAAPVQAAWQPQAGERVLITNARGRPPIHGVFRKQDPNGSGSYVVDTFDSTNTHLSPTGAGMLFDPGTIKRMPAQPAAAQQQWHPAFGEVVRLSDASGNFNGDAGAHYRYVGPHTNPGHVNVDLHVRQAGAADYVQRFPAPRSQIWHATRDTRMAPDTAPQPPQRETWPPTAGRSVRVIDSDSNFIPGAHTYGEPDADGEYHTVHMRDATGNSLGRVTMRDTRIYHPTRNESLRAALAQQHHAQTAAPQSPEAAPGDRLSELLRKVYPANPGAKAQQVRQHFARVFGRAVPDWAILKALRVPMTYANGPQSPHYDARNLEMHVSMDDPGSISAHVRSTVPGYDFTAKTSVRKNGIYNSYQHHDGERGTETKHISTPHILLNQADAAHALGIPHLEVSAAMAHHWSRKGDYTGGIVWPRYGYNAKLSRVVSSNAFSRITDHLSNYGVTGGADGPTLHDVMTTPGGYELLSHFEPELDAFGMPRKNGSRHYINAPEGAMKFDTAPGSMSRRLLAERIASVERGGKKNAKS